MDLDSCATKILSLTIRAQLKMRVISALDYDHCCLIACLYLLLSLYELSLSDDLMKRKQGEKKEKKENKLEE